MWWDCPSLAEAIRIDQEGAWHIVGPSKCYYCYHYHTLLLVFHSEALPSSMVLLRFIAWWIQRNRMRTCISNLHFLVHMTATL